MPDPLLIAKHGDIECSLLPALANRHGLITGATGTGKTVTLQVIAERLSAIGVPVFMADVKGDLAGLSQPGKSSPKFERAAEAGRRRRARLRRLPDGVLGRLRRAGPPGPRDGLRHGARCCSDGSSTSTRRRRAC